MLTPVDLETTVFRRGFRGYRTKEVQEFMEHLTIDYEHLYKENINLKEDIENLQSQLERYRQVEATLKNTLVLAQSTAEEVKNAGQKQADLILREANHRAEQIRGRVREEIQNELQQLANLKQQSDMFRLQFKKFLEGLGELVERKFNMDDFWDKLQEMTQEISPPTMDGSFTEEEAESEPSTNAVAESITEKMSFVIGD